MATVHLRTARPPWGRVLVSAALVALLALVVVEGRGWADRIRAMVAPAGADPVAQAVGWADANLPQGVRVATDAATMAALERHGLADMLLDYRELDAQPAAYAWQSVDYVVSTPALRSGLVPSSQTRVALASSTVVASYGVGAGRAEVREVDASGLAAAAARDAAMAAASADAGRQLLANRNVRLSPAAQLQVVGGMVDARILSVLVGLGAQHTVTVGAFSDPDPGGLFANRMRQVAILVVDGTLVADGSQPVDAVRGWLAAQQGQFRPSAVAVHGDQLLVRFRVVGPREAAAL